MKEKTYFVSRARIKARMGMLGLTQLELCKRTGISTGTLSRKLNGLALFDESDIVQLKRVLGKEIFYAEPSSQNANQEKGES